MVIHPILHVEGTLTQQQVWDISVWSQQTSQSIHGVSAFPNDDGASSTSRLLGTSASLTIPLDDEHHAHNSLPIRGKTATNGEDNAPVASATYHRREPLCRDSLKRRDALLKGKEGSRRRQRWENDRLLNNPWAQPPSAIDWQVQPTYPRRTVPYYLAPLWDSHFAAKEHSKISGGTRKDKQGPNSDFQSQITKELRLRLKHARAARGLLRDLEEEIRRFVGKYHENQTVAQDEVSEVTLPQLSHEERRKLQQDVGKENQNQNQNQKAEANSDSDDGEVVFVGRKAQMHNRRSCTERSEKSSNPEIARAKQKDSEMMVFESLEEDRAARFGRWLVHALASYYGLRTWSVIFGNPARREVYVGIDHRPPPLKQRQGSHSSTMPHRNMSTSTGHHATKIKPVGILPQPLWVTVGAS
ncbi:hypothetical protein PAAG_08558 [Paracoccidioides lutzii Pb01]|uniref:R3H-associated N-terminal domain-containing protein n=1 Tax=Paracoccidioides lutzii (strain ATCC MYA-826 / Pb01) TaxID=502779 RepID=C1HCR7_PARBA|nr:hypothetical protein PAAG_08558 [Paracoccidioides lutzii Pb01]EEH38831.1 hypothetical protein PAAG_08558 [Paracoccidioides lutzii Pb01]